MPAVAHADSTRHLTAQNVQPTIKAMILDDSEFDRAKLRRQFQLFDLPVSIHEASDMASLETALRHDVFDVILIDHNLADKNGFDALALLKQSGRHRGTACIMITGNDQSDVAVRALKKGCADYIPKHDLSPERLKSSIVSAIAEVSKAAPASSALTTDVDALTDAIMGKYSSALQPEVAGMLRQIRTLKSLIETPNVDAARLLKSVEQRCADLWQTLRCPQVPGAKSFSPQPHARGRKPIGERAPTAPVS